MRAHVGDLLDLDGLLDVLHLLLVDHVVEEEEVDPGTSLGEDLDQFKVVSFLHEGKFLFFEIEREDPVVKGVIRHLLVAELIVSHKLVFRFLSENAGAFQFCRLLDIACKFKNALDKYFEFLLV